MIAGSPASSQAMKSADSWGAFDLASTVSVQPPSVDVVRVWSPSIDGKAATAVFSNVVAQSGSPLSWPIAHEPQALIATVPSPKKLQSA